MPSLKSTVPLRTIIAAVPFTELFDVLPDAIAFVNTFRFVVVDV